jgi:transcription initiation factor TFIIH subunit 1
MKQGCLSLGYDVRWKKTNYEYSDNFLSLIIGRNLNTFYTSLLQKTVSFLEVMLSEDGIFIVTTRLQSEAEGWCSVARPQTAALVNPAAAVSALGELTPGGALMKGFEEESLAREF